ncbi:ABC transporter permease [Flavobacterium sp.]|jgi:lipoprotein-releasing system permease protein|uniref:ABC transporter permease n=1 Tax=Flavobacterium sp. TaxID=239 RepID=UPI0025C351F9|nr:ABC transporter permease [Flavobacterium sp.]
MNINLDIAKTYLFSNKKMTAVATLGVVLGMSIYIFMNSMLVGFDKSSSASIFKTTPHIRIYNDDVISKPLVQNSKEKFIIINPKIVPKNNTIINPKLIIETLLKQPEVTVVTPQVATNVFFNNGKSQIAGSAIGIKPEEANIMFDIKSYMVEGNFDLLKSNPNGIIIGTGIAEKMSLGVGDNLSITSSKAVTKNLKIIGLFKTNNSKVDKTTSYVNIASAQQFLKEGASYVTDINVNVFDPEQAEKIAETLSIISGYKAEGWKQANATFMAANKMRKIIILFVSFTILIVAGFGIYNILNMTITQKINDIAILKAMGFKGKDVIRIFVTQAISIGVAGVIGGMLIATILISILKKVYVGGDIGYFPIDFEPLKYLQGVIVGLIITFLAGYIPAKKAAKVDPVSIFRK